MSLTLTKHQETLKVYTQTLSLWSNSRFIAAVHGFLSLYNSEYLKEGKASLMGVSV